MWCASLQVHEIHVWQLDEERLIGTAHLAVSGASNYYAVLDAAKGVFHAAGVHATTMQVEFVLNSASATDVQGCFDMVCGSGCAAAQCCLSPEEGAN